MNKSDRCDRCPDEDTNECDTCNPNEDTSDQDKLMTEISDKFFALRDTIRKKHFGERTNEDIKQISRELSEKCKDLAEAHTKKAEEEHEQMELTYTFVLREGVCAIEGLHNDLDRIVESLGFGLTKSTLESPDEICEHDFEEETEVPVIGINPSQEYCFETGV